MSKAEKRAVDALAAEAAGESAPTGNKRRPVELTGPGGTATVVLLAPLDWAADVADAMSGEVTGSMLLHALRGMVDAEGRVVVDRIRPSNRCLIDVLLTGSESPGESQASQDS